MKIRMERAISTSLILIAAATVFALMLAVPGETVTTRYLNDLFLILDGTYRVASGQVPSRDFHTVLGPLSHYLPAVGYSLSGGFGGAMPVSMALATLVLALPITHILGSRLQPVLAIPFGIFLLLIVAVPINLGESITALSFAKYYNRLGWAALGALLVMYLPPARRQARQSLLDTLCAAFLTLAMLYTKVTYGAVALAFLAFMLFDRAQRRWAAGALGIVVLAALVIEAFWQASTAHLADIAIAFEVGGRLRGTWGQITDHILGNLADYVLLGLLAGLALWQTRSIRDALFYAFCAIAGFLIINQNFQAWGIIMLHAASAVAAQTILRAQKEDALDLIERRWSTGAGVKLLFLALVLPTIVHCAAALGLHAVAASTGAGQAIALPHLEKVRLANLWSWSDHDAAAAYLATVQDGAEALANLDTKPDGVFVLDVANPFSMVLGATPPKNDTPWLQWDRTLNGSSFIPAEQLLANVQIVMEPKLTGEAEKDTSAAISLQALYGAYITANFELVRETQYWKIHRRSQFSEPQATLKADRL